MIAANHSGVAKALLEANAYLRNPTSGFYGRRFQIYVDLLAAPNQIQTRSYKDDYFVVVTPSPEPQIEEIRHAYLHYLLDPLSLRHFEQLSKLKPLADFAAPAPALDDAYKDDFLLLSTECLIKAVEIRLAHGAENRQALASRDLSEGFVLTPAFTDGLQAYEKQVEAMRFYFVDLVGQIDLAAEDKRLEHVQFAKEAAVKKAKHVRLPPEPVLTGAAKTLQGRRRVVRQARSGQRAEKLSPGARARLGCRIAREGVLWIGENRGSPKRSRARRETVSEDVWRFPPTRKPCPGPIYTWAGWRTPPAIANRPRRITARRWRSMVRLLQLRPPPRRG